MNSISFHILHVLNHSRIWTVWTFPESLHSGPLEILCSGPIKNLPFFIVQDFYILDNSRAFIFLTIPNKWHSEPLQNCYILEIPDLDIWDSSRIFISTTIPELLSSRPFANVYFIYKYKILKYLTFPEFSNVQGEGVKGILKGTLKDDL